MCVDVEYIFGGTILFHRLNDGTCNERIIGFQQKGKHNNELLILYSVLLKDKLEGLFDFSMTNYDIMNC